VAQGASLSSNPSTAREKKYPTQKRAGQVAQVVECLRTKHEALTSNPYTTKKKKKKKKNQNIQRCQPLSKERGRVEVGVCPFSPGL
jgi:hypothetical protein